VRRNSDELRRERERLARTSGSAEDAFRAAVEAERLDGQASRLDKVIGDNIWKSGEVVNPRDPAAWAFRDDRINKLKVAKLIDEAINNPDDDGSSWISVTETPNPTRRPAFAASAFAWHNKPTSLVLIGVKAVPFEAERMAGRWAWTDDRAPELVFGHTSFREPIDWTWVRDRIAVTLDFWFENMLDADEVRVLDNQGRTADRYSILLSGRLPDGDPFYFGIACSAHPYHPQGVCFMGVEGIDPENPRDDEIELDPWQHQVPADVFDLIWNERGRPIVKVPRELAERWALLVRGGHFDR